jgi:hypothetical protein
LPNKFWLFACGANKLKITNKLVMKQRACMGCLIYSTHFVHSTNVNT